MHFTISAAMCLYTSYLENHLQRRKPSKLFLELTDNWWNTMWGKTAVTICIPLTDHVQSLISFLLRTEPLVQGRIVHFRSFRVLTQGSQGSLQSVSLHRLDCDLKTGLLASVTDRMTGKLNAAAKRLQEVLGSDLDPRTGYTDWSVSWYPHPGTCITSETAAPSVHIFPFKIYTLTYNFNIFNQIHFCKTTASVVWSQASATK